MTIEVIDDSCRLLHFQDEWQTFLRSVVPANPFQTPEWLLTWWSHFGSGKLQVLVFRHNGEMAGVLPCFLHEWKGRRQLTPIGAGMTDYLDPLLDQRHSAEIVEGFGRRLAHDAEWEICDWQELSANTPLAGLGSVREETPCSDIVLPSSFEEFIALRPKDLRRNLKRYKEKAEAIAPVVFTTTGDADPDLLSALIELHRRRWRKSGETGTIASNRAAGFVRDVAAALARRGMLRMFALRFQERVSAVIMALTTARTTFSYLSAFNPEYERFGFGRELIAQSFRFAHRNGYQEWNFLRGEEPYKCSWGARRIAKCRLVLERSS